MSNISLLDNDSDGHFTFALSPDTSFNEFCHLVHAMATSGQVRIKSADFYPAIPQVGISITDAPLSLNMDDGAWEMCYGLNTEDNVESDFEPLAVLDIEQLRQAFWGLTESSAGVLLGVESEGDEDVPPAIVQARCLRIVPKSQRSELTDVDMEGQGNGDE